MLQLCCHEEATARMQEAHLFFSNAIPTHSLPLLQDLLLFIHFVFASCHEDKPAEPSLFLFASFTGSIETKQKEVVGRN